MEDLWNVGKGLVLLVGGGLSMLALNRRRFLTDPELPGRRLIEVERRLFELTSKLGELAFKLTQLAEDVENCEKQRATDKSENRQELLTLRKELNEGLDRLTNRLDYRRDREPPSRRG